MSNAKGSVNARYTPLLTSPQAQGIEHVQSIVFQKNSSKSYHLKDHLDTLYTTKKQDTNEQQKQRQARSIKRWEAPKPTDKNQDHLFLKHNTKENVRRKKSQPANDFNEQRFRKTADSNEPFEAVERHNSTQNSKRIMKTEHNPEAGSSFAFYKPNNQKFLVSTPTPTPSIKDDYNKKTVKDKSNKIDGHMIKKDKPARIQEKAERQGSINQLLKQKQEMAIIVVQQSRRIRYLEQRLQVVMKAMRLEQTNERLKKQTMELAAHNNQRLYMLKENRALLQKNRNQQVEIESIKMSNHQLEAKIKDLQVSKEQYLNEYNPQLDGYQAQISRLLEKYTQLTNRLKESEQLSQKLLQSNSCLREQYAQLHTNIQRISDDRARQLNQQLEQQSFHGPQASKFHSSSIR